MNGRLHPLPLIRNLSIGLLLAVSPSVAGSADPVQATIESEQAWAGEPVLMIITLYSPGPFSGTASFDLPELPSTAIMRFGRPLVGNETIEDESWFTQRHELHVFTQQIGTVMIPSFQVRFEGKRTFTSDAEPMQGTTPELSFESLRPPDADGAELICSATGFDVRQTWTPDDEGLSVEAGDVVQRSVSIQAGGTTAMMLPSVPPSELENVRIYRSDPELQDRSERGQTGSSRREVVRYQFEQPGTYVLPAIDYIWWDYQQEQLRQESLDGKTIEVTGTSTLAEETELTEDQPKSWAVFQGVLIIAVTALMLYRPLRTLLARLVSWWNAPESVACRRVVAACRANDASAAYAAVLEWDRLMQQTLHRIDAGSSDDAALRTYQNECQSLSARLFSAAADQKSWHGGRLLSAFSEVRRRQRNNVRQKERTPTLPSLNPVRRAGIHS